MACAGGAEVQRIITVYLCQELSLEDLAAQGAFRCVAEKDKEAGWGETGRPAWASCSSTFTHSQHWRGACLSSISTCCQSFHLPF